jgi:hypothetical protein
LRGGTFTTAGGAATVRPAAVATQSTVPSTVPSAVRAAVPAVPHPAGAVRGLAVAPPGGPAGNPLPAR